MFGHAPETDFDLRFPIGPIPVRVHPVFWLTAAFLTWGSANGRPDLIVIGIAIVFISIMVHELGHAILLRIFGFPSNIVLYFFGGYATATRKSTWKDIATLAAGPAAGFALYGVLVGIQFGLTESGVARNWPLEWKERVGFAILFGKWCNLAWSCFNLVPVAPMDGGQICQRLCEHYSPRKGTIIALKIAIATSGALALYSLFCIMTQRGMLLNISPRMPLLMFAYMAYQNYTIYQNYTGRGGGFR